MWSKYICHFCHIWRSVGWPPFQPIHQSRVINIVLGTAVDKRWKIKSYPTVAFLILTFCGFTAISVFPSEFVNSIAMINSFNWKCIIMFEANMMFCCICGRNNDRSKEGQFLPPKVWRNAILTWKTNISKSDFKLNDIVSSYETFFQI